MINLGKIHRNLFLGIFGMTVPFPDLASITTDYIIPLIKENIQTIPSGKTILFISGLMIFITSSIWIKETIEDLERTSRFMDQSQFNVFMVKTIAIGILAISVGLIVNKILLI
jgi:hypothetical protein